jgi:bifunctional DNA-binding transcriptional regulator/antitoxin component of YhaV-PrlF toxin-antitoxin module
MYELVKMSPKGQLVVPQPIRESAGFKEGDRFVAYPVEQGIVFKRVDIPELKADFMRLSKEISTKFAEKGVTPKDVEDAVRWARKK